SSQIVWLLTVRTKPGYTREFGIADDHRARKNVVNLTSRLNKHGEVSPRLGVHLKDLEQTWRDSLLPPCQFSFLALTTSANLMDYEEARQEITQEGKLSGSFSRDIRDVKLAGQWWLTPLLPALGRQRQADLCEFEASLVYKS
ncbi:40S ribosomal protein S15a, partial [Lemmus lemmus]